MAAYFAFVYLFSPLAYKALLVLCVAVFGSLCYIIIKRFVSVDPIRLPCALCMSSDLKCRRSVLKVFLMCLVLGRSAERPWGWGGVFAYAKFLLPYLQCSVSGMLYEDKC